MTPLYWWQAQSTIIHLLKYLIIDSSISIPFSLWIFANRFLDDLPPETKEGFDLITAFDVIHDIPQPAAALANTNALLKPNT